MEPVAVERFAESSERESIIMAPEMRVGVVHDVRFSFPKVVVCTASAEIKMLESDSNLFQEYLVLFSILSSDVISHILGRGGVDTWLPIFRFSTRFFFLQCNRQTVVEREKQPLIGF